MTEPNSKELLDARIARRLFETVLATCERLPEIERERLLKDIARQILERIEKNRPSTEPGVVQIVGIEIK